jgi:HEAT repeat protein
MRLLIDALQSAGHSEAQAALGAAVRERPNDWPALAQLIPALGTAELPTPETVQTLLELAFGKHDPNVRAAAQLALGNLAGSLAEAAPARSGRVVARLLEELAAPTAADSTWQLLLALGNAGSADALPALTRYLDDPAPELRGAAAWALRWVEASQVDQLLTARGLVDRDAAVRLEAVRALGFRERTAGNCAAQEKALAAEGAADLRLALLGNLWKARAVYPRARRLVEQAATGDPAREVREAAAKLLEQAPGD